MNLGRNGGFFLLILLFLALALLAAGCHEEKKETASPMVAQPSPSTSEKEVPTQEPEPSTGELTPGGEKEMVIEGEEGQFISEADVIKAIWTRFQREGGKIKGELRSWLNQTINALKQEGLFPKGKEDEQFKAFMLSLLTHCSTNPQDRLCQEPWKLSYMPIDVYSLNAAQLSELERSLKEIIARDTGLSGGEVRAAAVALRGVLAGEAACVKEGICALEDLFSGFTKLNAETKAKLLWDIQSYLQQQVHYQGWQPKLDISPASLVFTRD